MTNPKKPAINNQALSLLGLAMVKTYRQYASESTWSDELFRTIVMPGSLSTLHATLSVDAAATNTGTKPGDLSLAEIYLFSVCASLGALQILRQKTDPLKAVENLPDVPFPADEDIIPFGWLQKDKTLSLVKALKNRMRKTVRKVVPAASTLNDKVLEAIIQPGNEATFSAVNWFAACEKAAHTNLETLPLQNILQYSILASTVTLEVAAEEADPHGDYAALTQTPQDRIIH